jgi:hypothetical protein
MRIENDVYRAILGAAFCKKDFEPIWPHDVQAKALLQESWWGEHDFLRNLIQNNPDYFVFRIVESKKPKYKIYYIGRPWNTLLMTETGADFRQSVANKLEAIFHKPIAISTIILPEGEDY